MKTLRKLLAGTILVALAAFGLTALTSSSNDPATTPVFGFTDKYCQNEDYKWFKNVGALIAADGKKDPKAKGKDKDKIWRYYSYIEDVEPWWPCLLLEYEDDVKAVGVTPKKKNPPPSGGGGGGGETPTPNPQEPKPPAQVPNPSYNVTDAEIESLKSCWEEKAVKKLNKKGWTSDATTAATWMIDRLNTRGLGQTWPQIKKVNGQSRLVLDVEIYSTGIGERAVGLVKWLYSNDDEGAPPGTYKLAFNHLTTYTYMHETYHVSQLLNIFSEREALPEPWEYWQLEVDAHRESKNMWVDLYDDPPPSVLPLGSEVNTERYAAYEVKKKEYLDLETELANPDTTEERKGQIERRLEKLTKWLQDPTNLPQAEGNSIYEASEVENFECD